MFICEVCLEKNFNNWSFHKSRGKCEICNKISDCHDIPSSRLEKKIEAVSTDELRKEEIQYIYELIQSCLEEEGYKIPFYKYADGNWKGFNVPLRNNKFTEMEDNLFIKIEWS